MKPDKQAKSALQDKKASAPRGRLTKDLVDIQRSIQSRSPEKLAKKILNTPPGKIKLL